MDRRQLLYLAGPMTGQTWDEAEGWRREAHRGLCGRYDCLSPLRGKDLCQERDGFAAADQADAPGYRDSDVVRRDIYDVSRCDVVLANYEGAERISIGTVMEQARAFVQGKYVAVVLPKGNIHDHCFVREHASIRFETLDDALAYLMEVLNDVYPR